MNPLRREAGLLLSGGRILSYANTGVSPQKFPSPNYFLSPDFFYNIVAASKPTISPLKPNPIFFIGLPFHRCSGSCACAALHI